jgi:hypothetical protein
MLTMLPSSVAIMEPSETLDRISHLRCMPATLPDADDGVGS